MKKYAVIDTNVLVSALLRWDSIPGKVVEHALVGKITPILNEKIIAEYDEVLRRKKFPFKENDIQILIEGIKKRGVAFNPAAIDESLPHTSDIVFYAVTMEARTFEEAYLVTGNIKHFPLKPYIVTPREMLAILGNSIEI